jgi:hypothetical protein
MFSVLALYPNMAQQILEELRVEAVLADLQQKRVATTAGASSIRALSASDEGDATRASMITTNTNLGEEADKVVLVSQKKSKTELWNELKIMSISPPSRADNRSCEDVNSDIFAVRSCTVIKNTIQLTRTTSLCSFNPCTGTRITNWIRSRNTANQTTGRDGIRRFGTSKKFP